MIPRHETLRVVLTVLAGAGLALTQARADHHDWRDPARCLPPPCPTLPPLTPVPPTEPRPPFEPLPSPTPAPAPAPVMPVEEPSLAGLQIGATAAESVALVSPNMFGDTFGKSVAVVTFARSPIFIPGIPATMRQDTFMLDSAGSRGAGGVPGFVRVLIPASGLSGDSVSIRGLPLAPTLFLPATFTGSGPGATAVVPESQLVTNFIAANFAAPGETVQFGSGLATFRELLFNGEFYDVSQTYSFLTPGTPGQMIPRTDLVVLFPNPAGGGVVGRTKVSEDNSPLPRDRVIFNFDYFDNTPLTPGGLDVRRYSPGFEKTFLNRNASVEVRFPFASTLDSDITAGGLTNTRTEFGNVHVTLKALLFGSDTVNVASGLGIGLPTADDTRVSLFDGTDLLRVNNESFILTPYFAVLLTPNNRLFVQTWASFAFDANGNPLEANTTLTGLQRAGRLTAQTLMALDAQVGYWVIPPSGPSGLLRGLAPFVELHYNTSLGDPDVIRSGGFLLTDIAGNIDELNLSAGLIAQVGDNLNVAVGAVAPLRNDFDRSFDYQIGVRLNYFFGPTARSRNRAIPASSF